MAVYYINSYDIIDMEEYANYAAPCINYYRNMVLKYWPRIYMQLL